MADFNPREHLVTWEAKKQVGGRWITQTVEYLPTKWRIVWFRGEHPKGRIVPEVLSHDDGGALVKATVTTEDDLQGIGHAYISSQSFSRAVEKAETQAIGRALAMLGYGTEFAIEFDNDEGPNLDNYPDTPVERPREAPEPRKPASNPEPQAQPAEGDSVDSGSPDPNGNLSPKRIHALTERIAKTTFNDAALKKWLVNEYGQRGPDGEPWGDTAGENLGRMVNYQGEDLWEKLKRVK